MTNIFKKILDELPSVKIEIITDDPEEQKIANQYAEIFNHKISKERKEFKTINKGDEKNEKYLDTNC